MYCDLCRKEQAVFFVRTSNGELHVCEACARRRGISTDGKKNGNEGKSNLTAIFSSILRAGAEETSGVCRRCGMSRMEVTKAGKVGCPHCYDVFSMEVAARLHAEGGVLSYNGAMPKNVRFPGTESYPEKQAGGAPEKAENASGEFTAAAGAFFSALPGGEKKTAEPVHLLREELRAAVLQEDYERAAVLRDRLKEAEGRHE